jgi:hypothetical protein
MVMIRERSEDQGLVFPCTLHTFFSTFLLISMKLIMFVCDASNIHGNRFQIIEILFSHFLRQLTQIDVRHLRSQVTKIL